MEFCCYQEMVTVKILTPRVCVCVCVCVIVTQAAYSVCSTSIVPNSTWHGFPFLFKLVEQTSESLRPSVFVLSNQGGNILCSAVREHFDLGVRTLLEKGPRAPRRPSVHELSVLCASAVNAVNALLYVVVYKCCQ